MKNKISYLLSALFFEIGDGACRICHVKHKGKYFFDGGKEGLKYKIGYWLAGIYQTFMGLSVKIQDWGGGGVWRSPTEVELSKLLK